MIDGNGPTEPQISDYDPANQQEPETTQEPAYAPVEPEAPWADILAKVPDGLRSELNPALEEYTKRVTEEWEPYGFLRENEVDPSTVQYAMNILYTLNNDPRQLYDALGQYYKFSAAQQTSESPDLSEGEFADEDDPRIARLEQGLQNMARLLLEARQEQEEQEEDALLEDELSAARQKYGDYDEGYVLGLALNGKSVEDAVRQYKALEQRLSGTPNQRQPVVMGSGGGAPGSAPVDPRKLSDRETKSLVTQMLEQAARS
jgi:hypothetical protein